MKPRNVLPTAAFAVGLAAFGALPAHADTGPKFEHVMNIGGEGVGEGQFKYVDDFAWTKDGKLLVTDAFHAWVQVFDAQSGAFVARFGGKGDDDHHLDKPEGIAVDPAGDIYVADYNTGFVKKYDPGFKWKLTFSEYGTAPGQNIKSEFMDFHDGKLFMPEAGNHRVNVFSPDGKFESLFGGMGTEPGKMNNPEAVRINSEGKIYVTDLKNDRIQVFGKDGKQIAAWGKTGVEPGEFKAPAGLAIDAQDRLYVTEIGNDRVQVFDKDGKFLTMWGTKGAGNGQFGNLHGISVDRKTGWVYVADRENHRIQVFDGNGKYETQWNNMHRPCGLCMTRGKNPIAVIGETGPGLAINAKIPGIGPRVSLWTHKGEPSARLGDATMKNPSQFIAPHGVAIDSRGDIYVGEVSRTAMKNKGTPVPDSQQLVCLQKLVKVS